MQISLDGKYTAQRSVVALGMFDGVHIGHRVLLRRAKALAKQRGVPLVVCTFLDHPLHLIAPEKCPPMLCTFEERNALMEQMGVDVLCAQPFTHEVMDMLPEEYVGHLVRRFHPTDVVCGYNHTFGRKGEGTPALLSALGAALGFATSIVPKITFEDEDVSSTVIRGLLADGDVDIAARMLERPYRLHASVHTFENGVCEAQLLNEGKQALPDGDYRAACSCGGKCYPVTLRLKGERVRFALPVKALPASELALDMLCNLGIAF